MLQEAKIENDSLYNFIGNGFQNCVETGGQHNIIGSGTNNCAVVTAGPAGGSPTYSGIFSGRNNTVSTYAASIVGGHHNTVSGTSSMIGSGCYNSIVGGAYTSFIGGGWGNEISGGSVAFSAIGGGVDNCVFGNANHGGIFTGSHNIICGTHSAILGGTGNCDNGNNCVGIFGDRLIAAAPNTFFVNCLNACDTPAAGVFPTGTLMWKSCTALVPADRVLVIAP